MKLNFILLIVLFSFFSPKTKAQTVWYLNTTSANSCLLLSSWTDQASGIGGTSPLSFTTAGHSWHFQNRPNNTILFASPMIFSSTSTIYIGNGIANTKL